MSANFATIIGTPGRPDLQRELRPRFYFAMALLYAAIILPYVSLYTSFGWVAVSASWVNPIFTFATAVVGTSLLLLALGTGELKRSTFIKCLAVIFVLGIAVDAAESCVNYVMEGGQLDWSIMRSVPRFYDGPYTTEKAAAAMGLLIGMVIVEECSKLLPVLLMIGIGKIRSMQSAMACAALAGLTFGLIESNLFGYTNLPGMQFSEYLMRYFSMSITHALWDALGAGLAFWFAKEMSPTFRSCMIGFAVTCVLHLLHNVLQEVITPSVQAITMCLLLLPVYALAKSARRASKVEDDFAFEIPVGLFVVLLMTVASAAALQMPWQNIRMGAQIVPQVERVYKIEKMLRGTPGDQPLDDFMREIRTEEIPIPHVREDFLDVIQHVQDSDAANLDGVDRTYAITLEAGRFSPVMIARAIAKREPYLKLDDARIELNHANVAAGLAMPFKPIRRWDIEVKSITPSDAVLHSLGSAKLRVLLVSGKQLEDDMLFPAAQSEEFAHQSFQPWQTSLALPADRPILILYAVDSGHILDAAVLPFGDVAGVLHMTRGSSADLAAHYDGQ